MTDPDRAATLITQTLPVQGMHCASCATLIAKRVAKVNGVKTIDVNVATEQATLTYDPDIAPLASLNRVISPLGYQLGASQSAPTNANEHTAAVDAGDAADTAADAAVDAAANTDLLQARVAKQQALARLRLKLWFVLPISGVMFALMLWEIAANLLPGFPAVPLPMALTNAIMFILASVVLFWVGWPFVRALAAAVRYRAANMDTLIGIGTLTAYLYSSLVFLFPGLASTLGLPAALYFDVTVVVIGFVTLGKYLEARSKLHMGEAIEKLLNLQAKSAQVRRGGEVVEMPIEQVVVGDTVLVKPGATIPVDGEVQKGSGVVDESMITGEPLPRDVQTGDRVVGGTINRRGHLTLTATSVGSQTVLAQIVRLVAQAQGSKAPIQHLADQIAAIFVPVVLIIAFASVVLWLTVGTLLLGWTQAVSFGLLCFVSVLVIACPCALGLATPTAIVVGVGKGASQGILVKNAPSLERLQKVDTVVFDKTGTLTSGQPTISTIIVVDQRFAQREVLQWAVSLEQLSDHPLARAIVEYGRQQQITPLPVTEFAETEGIGVTGLVSQQRVALRKALEAEQAPGAEPAVEVTRPIFEAGQTAVMIEADGRLVAALGISDTPKSTAQPMIARLQALGLSTVLLTGDNDRAAQQIGRALGVDRVVGQVLPQDKAQIIRDLQAQGKTVAMVGDGINDAPALTQADVGLALASGTDIAIESADITLLAGEISKIPQAIALARSTIRTIKQNLFWAFFYNIIGLPLAAGVFYPLFGVLLNPMFAGLAMALSSVSVVSNSLLLKRK